VIRRKNWGKKGKLLNQGELVIKWHRQIKNKGNLSYIAA
jgi:hypothetical protein